MECPTTLQIHQPFVVLLVITNSCRMRLIRETGDGTCIIDLEISNIEGQDFDHGNAYDMKKAAGNVISQCVYSSSHIGGTISGLGRKTHVCLWALLYSLTCLGQYGRISLSVSQYLPNVQCTKGSMTPKDLRMCQVVLNNMPALNSRQVFGTGRGDHIDVQLPHLIEDRKSLPLLQQLVERHDFSRTNGKPAGQRCPIEISIDGPPQYYTWHGLWGAAVAVVGMCVTQGLIGQAFIAGEHIWLFFRWLYYLANPVTVGPRTHFVVRTMPHPKVMLSATNGTNYELPAADQS